MPKPLGRIFAGERNQFGVKLRAEEERLLNQAIQGGPDEGNKPAPLRGEQHTQRARHTEMQRSYHPSRENQPVGIEFRGQRQRFAFAVAERGPDHFSRDRLLERHHPQLRGQGRHGRRDFGDHRGWNEDGLEQMWEEMELRDFREGDNRTGVGNDDHSERVAIHDFVLQLVASELEVRNPTSGRMPDELGPGHTEEFRSLATRERPFAIEFEHDQLARRRLRRSAETLKQGHDVLVQFDVHGRHAVILLLRDHALEVAHLSEADKRAVADHEVVQQLDAQQRASGRQPSREIDVLRARLRIARRMIVRLMWR